MKNEHYAKAQLKQVFFLKDGNSTVRFDTCTLQQICPKNNNPLLITIPPASVKNEPHEKHSPHDSILQKFVPCTMEANNGKLLIIAAPSGAGKTTIANFLLREFPLLAFSISATTRAPRAHEVDGQHYYFLGLEEFRQKIAEGAFLEWEEVYPGRFYGTLFAEVDRILSEGKAPVFDVDVKGALNIKHLFKDQAISCFIMPPSPDVLRDRLFRRNTDSPEEIERRLAKAHEELAFAPEFDHVIVNDNLERACQEMRSLVLAGIPQLQPTR